MKQSLFEHVEGNQFKLRQTEGIWDKAKGAYNRVMKPYSPEAVAARSLQVGEEVICIAPRWKGKKCKIVKLSPNGSNALVKFPENTDYTELPALTLQKI